MIQFTSLCVRFHTKEIVRNATLSVPDGHVAVFIGANGAGKTTTLKAGVGLLPHTGSTNLDGCKRSKELGISLGPESLPADITLSELLRLGKTTDFVDEADSSMRDLQIEKYRNHKVQTLSTGTKQKISLIEAFRYQPKNIILDEPHNGLDPQSIDWLEHRIRQAKNHGSAVLMSSHLLREAGAVADMAYEIQQGIVKRHAWPIESATPAQWNRIWVKSNNPRRLAEHLDWMGANSLRDDSILITNSPVSRVLSIARRQGVEILDIGPY